MLTRGLMGIETLSTVFNSAHAAPAYHPYVLQVESQHPVEAQDMTRVLREEGLAAEFEDALLVLQQHPYGRGPLKPNGALCWCAPSVQLAELEHACRLMSRLVYLSMDVEAGEIEHLLTLLHLLRLRPPKERVLPETALSP